MIVELQDAHIRLRAARRQTAGTSVLPSHETLVRVARRGRSDPRSLTPLEVSQVCRALVVHYAQMGIG